MPILVRADILVIPLKPVLVLVAAVQVEVELVNVLNGPPNHSAVVVHVRCYQDS